MSAPKISETTTDRDLLGRRDAFHVPGVLVVCESPIEPGSHVRFINTSFRVVEVTDKSDCDAIVDPFLRSVVPARTLFWVFLIPGMVQNLTHTFVIQKQQDQILPPARRIVLANMQISVSNSKIPEVVVGSSDEEVEDDDGCKGCYD